MTIWELENDAAAIGESYQPLNEGQGVYCRYLGNNLFEYQSIADGTGFRITKAQMIRTLANYPEVKLVR